QNHRLLITDYRLLLTRLMRGICNACSNTKINNIFALPESGALAQLARALQWHGRGHRFDSDMLHTRLPRSLHMPAGNKVAKGLSIRVADRQHGLTYLHLILMHNVDRVQRDDVRVMDAHEFFWRQLSFQSLQPL